MLLKHSFQVWTKTLSDSFNHNLPIEIYVRESKTWCFKFDQRIYFPHPPNVSTMIRRQPVSGGDNSVCGSSPALCYGRLRSCAIHKYFASCDGGFIRACRAKRADCQWTKVLSNLIIQNRRSLPVFEGKRNSIF